MARTNLKARTGLLAGAATIALLALPGIANANITEKTVDAAGKLTVTSDAGDPITITCDGGWVKINNADPSNGLTACDDLTAIVVNGGPGDNAINLEDVNGDFSSVTSVLVNGNDGIDTIDGSQLADRLVGGDANDTVAGHGGNDTLVWNGGNDDDINDGGDGLDTIEVNGNGTATISETFTVKPDAAQPGRIRFDRAAPTPNPPGLFFLDIGTSEVLDLNMNGGNDTLTADAGLDALGFKVDADGGPGDDIIDGSDAADLLKGGDGNDTITPDDNPVGTVDDARGDAGNDTIVWNGGDDNDRNDGGDGDDTSLVNGATANETFTVKPGAAGHVVFDRTSTNPQAFTVDMTTTERLRLLMNAGDDAITADGGITPLHLDIDGGPGADAIDGGDGADTLSGGADNDTIVPDDNPAGTHDVANGDAGDDTITWNGGDDDDINNGGDGSDTSVINGATAAERFTIMPGATAGRVQFDRTSTNPAPFSVDIGTTELLRLNANDGDDVIKGFKGLDGLIETELNGEGGGDQIRGTDAEDRINAGKGRDLVNSVDRAEDLLDCGPGLDLALVDRRDFLRSCNIVIGGRLHVKAPKSAHVSGHTAALRLKCAGTKKCKGVARLRSGGKTLGSTRFSIKSGKKTVRLELNGKGKRLMAKAPAKRRAVKLQIDAKDSDGNGWRSTSRLTLK